MSSSGLTDKRDTHIFTRSPSFNSVVSSLSGEKCPTMLHSRTTLSLALKSSILVDCGLEESYHVV